MAREDHINTHGTPLGNAIRLYVYDRQVAATRNRLSDDVASGMRAIARAIDSGTFDEAVFESAVRQMREN